MINIETYINGFSELVNQPGKAPWEITQNLNQLITSHIALLSDDYIVNNDVAIHKTAIIENNVTTNYYRKKLFHRSKFIFTEWCLPNG